VVRGIGVLPVFAGSRRDLDARGALRRGSTRPCWGHASVVFPVRNKQPSSVRVAARQRSAGRQRVRGLVTQGYRFAGAGVHPLKRLIILASFCQI
jgi:hypothetical protein